jgi:hypothetical protein
MYFSNNLVRPLMIGHAKILALAWFLLSTPPMLVPLGSTHLPLTVFPACAKQEG